MHVVCCVLLRLYGMFALIDRRFLWSVLLNSVRVLCSKLVQQMLRSIPFANLAVAVSNLYGLRVVSYQVSHNNELTAVLFLCSVMCSFMFHIIETREVIMKSPRIWQHFERVHMPGITNDYSDAFLELGMNLLLWDRIFAIACVVRTVIFILRMHTGNKVTLKWQPFLTRIFVSLLLLLYSDLVCTNLWLFVMSHCAWHVSVFHIALLLYDVQSTSMWKPQRKS